ncbi:Glu/Leu/Phe/Val dehydrogenase [Parvularcula flava]|nr:Glu/Leu/Phe/Val dehydrogenase [Aquisalinus luteolus]
MQHHTVQEPTGVRDGASRLRLHRLEGYDSHERVVRVEDTRSGLRAIIAVHSTALGPAGGGCRLWTYRSQGEAIADVLNLSRGMTYKNALADVGFGGGKAVILGPVPKTRREDVFRSFGRAVNMLGGKYITAEDVGVAVSDMEQVSRETKFVCGLKEKNGIGGDPSLFTARGVLQGMKAAMKVRYQAGSLKGARVAVQGLGSVGAKLCDLLAAEGARLVVADIDEERAARLQARHGASRASLETILLEDVEVVAPCALGGAITGMVAKNMRAKVIAGAANNQLASREVEDILRRRHIAYAPDYVINAGGIIMVAAEYRGQFDPTYVRHEIDRIYQRTEEIVSTALRRDVSTVAVANEMVEQRLARR